MWGSGVRVTVAAPSLNRYRDRPTKGKGDDKNSPSCLGFAAGCSLEPHLKRVAGVGDDIVKLKVEFGPPDHQFDMPDGRRAFQWRV